MSGSFAGPIKWLFLSALVAACGPGVESVPLEDDLLADTTASLTNPPWISSKVGQSLSLVSPSPSENLRSLEVALDNSQWSRRATVTQIDRDRDGQLDAVLITEAGIPLTDAGRDSFLGNRDTLIFIDALGRRSETFTAYDGQIRGHEQVQWESEREGLRLANHDRNGNGRADYFRQDAVYFTDADPNSPPNFWQRAGLPPAAVHMWERSGKRSAVMSDENEDGNWERRRYWE